MSLVSGNSILHIANRLVKKDQMAEGDLEHLSSNSPVLCSRSPQMESNDSNDIFSLFKQNNIYASAAASNTVAGVSNLPNALQMGCNSTGSAASSEDCNEASNDISYSDSMPSNLMSNPCFDLGSIDLAAAVSQMQKHLAASQQNLFQQGLDMGAGAGDMKLEADLLPGMPGYSPWLRNAGRKKSHPVWDFFKDLKDTNGIGGVVCLHCSWSGDDRSPNNLRTHLKKFHSSDGIFAKFSQKLAQTPTQPYVKRQRAGAHQNSNGGILSQVVSSGAGTPLTGSSSTPAGASSSAENTVAMALQQMQAQMGPLSSFLDNLPKSNEVINISAGFCGKTEEDDGEHANEPGSSGASASGERAASGSPVVDPETSGGSPSVSSTNQLNAFMNMATNPLMWTSMLANSSHGSAFTLNDGQCVSMLMKMAIDLDLTLSYHKRRGDIELCFESNRTAEKSGGRGKVLCLCDVGREIRVTERVNGTPTDSEMWLKTDFNQFHWAIRGKCQKVLLKA